MSLSSVGVHLQLTQSQNWLLWQRPLDPRSRECFHWIACSRKPTPRIKQRVASCHTTEVIAHRKPKQWLPWQRPLVAGCRQCLHAVGRPLKPPSITNRLVPIVHTKPVIAILVPKLVAMATSLRPSISGMSSLDSFTPKTYP